MNKGTRNQLDVKLKKMLDHLDQAKAKKKQLTPQSGTGNVIRRRKGEKDKRFSMCIKNPGAFFDGSDLTKYIEEYHEFPL